MLRILALFFLLIGLVRTWFDWQETVALADPFRFAELGTVWAEVHFGSLQVLQPAVERYIGPWLWEGVIFPVLFVPFAPACFVLAAVLWFTARWRRQRR